MILNAYNVDRILIGALSEFETIFNNSLGAKENIKIETETETVEEVDKILIRAVNIEDKDLRIDPSGHYRRTYIQYAILNEQVNEEINETSVERVRHILIIGVNIQANFEYLKTLLMNKRLEEDIANSVADNMETNKRARLLLISEKLQEHLEENDFHCFLGQEDKPAEDYRITMYISYTQGVQGSLY